MTIQQIRYLMAVLYAGSISKAAKQLYTAQSSVSKAIHELETEYGFPIFQRTAKGVELTREGQAFVIDVKMILKKVDMVETKYSRQRERHIAFSVSSQHHLPSIDAFYDLLASDPENLGKSYFVNFWECRTSDIFENVSSGISDVGVVFFTSESKDLMIQNLRRLGLVFNHITYQPVHVYLQNAHPLAGHSCLREEQLAEYPFVSYDRSLQADPTFTDTLSGYVHRTINVTDRAAAYELLHKLNGYVIGSGFLTDGEARDGITAIPLCTDSRWEIGWVTRIKASLPDCAHQYVRYLARRLEEPQPRAAP